MTFQLLRLQPDPAALAPWATRHGLLSPDGDFGYALHALLSAHYAGSAFVAVMPLTDNAALAAGTLDPTRCNDSNEDFTTSSDPYRVISVCNSDNDTMLRGKARIASAIFGSVTDFAIWSTSGTALRRHAGGKGGAPVAPAPDADVGVLEKVGLALHHKTRHPAC